MNVFPKYSLALDSSGIADNFSFDDPIRSKCVNSFLFSIFHFKEKKHLNAKLSQDLTSFFKQRYGIQDNSAFKRIWTEVGDKVWKTSSPLTARALREIDKAFQSQLVFHGAGIAAPAEQPLLATDKAIFQSVRAILHGGPLSLDLIDMRILKAVLIGKDTGFLNDFRQELQVELQQIAENPPQNGQEEVLWRAFLGNVLALLPYTYPENGQKIKVPILSDEGTCRLVDYEIEVIPLTPKEQATPLIALGLMPTHEKTPPILSYSGTTYPAGDGFIASIFADFTPGKSVGDRPYRQGQNNLNSWLEGKEGVHVIGMSLGGALSLHTLRHHHAILGRIDVFNPPGLYPWNWTREYHEGCNINIYCQAGDFTSSMGFWPVGDKVSLYEIIPHQNTVSEGPFVSHAKVFTGCEKVTILAKDSRKANETFYRKALTYIHLISSPLVFLPIYIGFKAYQLTKLIISLFAKTIHYFAACVKISGSEIKRRWKSITVRKSGKPS